ncbi:MAG: phosphatidylserine decarboxylase family protein [Magnetococcales bacterium]|nr:phosphatidylserine decarboxylase family protein [Magnetococcales bacterium]
MASRSPIAREGFPFIAIFIAVAIIGTLTNSAFPLGNVLLWILALWCIWFFRDPDRNTPVVPGGVIAPADGRVVAIEEVAQAPLSGEPARKFSIFMNVFNVHVNRSPMEGTVTDLAYHKGQFVNAALDKASIENERMEILLTLPNGTKLPFVQVAGLVARRIICRAVVGDRLQAGERFGLIRFGSRVDIYLPLDAEVKMGLGDITLAGESVIAQLGEVKPS